MKEGEEVIIKAGIKRQPGYLYYVNGDGDVVRYAMLNAQKFCPDCGGLIEIRNPTGHCDHLYYPEAKAAREQTEEQKDKCIRCKTRYKLYDDFVCLDCWNKEQAKRDFDGLPERKFQRNFR